MHEKDGGEGWSLPMIKRNKNDVEPQARHAKI